MRTVGWQLVARMRNVSDENAMIEAWGRPVEQILLTATDSKARVLGVVSPDGNSGVSTLCRALADAAMRAGSRTLLIDLAQPVERSSHGGWKPSDGAARAIQANPGSYDILEVRPTAETRPLFNNVGTLQNMFERELRDYNFIVLDLPCALHRELTSLNPVAAARASDLVVLVCVAGKTTQARVKSAVAVLDAAGVRLGGLVLNDVSNPALGQRLAAGARRISPLSPTLSAWLERKALEGEFLNAPL